MTEQKAKSAIKKVAAAKSGHAPDVKSKTGKVTVAAKKPAAKKPAVKKPAVKKPAAKIPPLAPAKPKAAKPPKKVAAATAESKARPAKADDKTDPATAAGRAAKSTPKTAAKPTPEERYRMVETAAYFIAEQHGFQGRSDEHWAAAEREIAAKLGQ